MTHHPSSFARRSLVLPALGLALLASQTAPGCGRGLTDGQADGVPTRVGTEGGVVRFSGGSIVVPSGALDTEATIATQVDPAGDAGPVGNVYTFTPDGLLFAAPVTLKLPSPANDQMGIGRGIGGDEWEAVPGSRYDAASRTVVAEITRLGRYGCMYLCSSSAPCSANNDCRNGVCQPHKADAGTGGTPGTGGAGTGGAPGTGGQGSGGTYGSGGVIAGTGGSITGTGGAITGTGGTIAGTGGNVGTGGAIAGTGGAGGCVLSDGGAVACGAVGAVCNANNECTSGYCKGAAASGGCTTDAICSCQLKPNGAACTTSAECMAGICVTTTLAPCTVDASCTCHAGG